MYILGLILITLLILLALIVIISPLYFMWGVARWFYHDVLEWHEPDEESKTSFDGCSHHCKCKHCGKDIMQDSQGNWF